VVAEAVSEASAVAVVTSEAVAEAATSEEVPSAVVVLRHAGKNDFINFLKNNAL
jgi:hypothetical protein